MSQVSLGPPLAVDGPLPQAPLYSLLNTAQVIEDPDPHWGAGVTVFGYPPSDVFTHDPCSAGTYRDKDEGEAPDLPIFGAYQVYLGITCSSFSAHGDWFQERALAAFRAKRSFGIARELSRGTANPLNPYLGDSNLTYPAGTSSVTPAVGLHWLEKVIGDTGIMGMIHAPPAVASSWTMSGGGNEIGRAHV